MFRYVAEDGSVVRANYVNKRTSLVGPGASVPYLAKSPVLPLDHAARLSALLCEPHATPGGVLKRAIANGEAPLGVVGKSSYLAGK